MQAVRWTMLASPGAVRGLRRSSVVDECVAIMPWPNGPDRASHPGPVLARQVCHGGLRSDR